MSAVIESKKVNLALQGGGAHGAYTWGVLDRLLEEPRLIIEGISGTSAGAMNAAMLVNGYMQGGNVGAKEMLHNFWKRISDCAAYSPLHKNPLERILTGWNMDMSPSYHFFDLLSRVFSPYELNPLDYNPMREIVEELLDVDAISACSVIKLFIAATHVGSGQARIFHCNEITVDVLMASTCIPFLFRAVEIEGEEYWDGGYMGNPAIWPLIYNCGTEDVILVQINPLHKAIMPRTASEIINRVNEITFNSSLTAEMRAIEFVSKLIRQGKLSHEDYKDVKMHLIYSPEEMKALNASSKMNADWDFFQYLKNIGYNAADIWLKNNWNDVGKKSTINLHNKFLCGAGVKNTVDSISDLHSKNTENSKKRAKTDEKQQA
ncbi:MAG: patatin-like phospholipase family protein [Rickettsiales bacterium]